MDVQIEERPHGVLVLKPQGARLDAVSAPGFRANTLPRIAGNTLVVLDLTLMQAADSTGLGAIVAVLKAIPGGGQLRLAHVPPSIRALLALTRLDRVIRSFDTVDAAVGPLAEAG
jgi:anti-sigma B factor antagonist